MIASDTARVMRIRRVPCAWGEWVKGETAWRPQGRARRGPREASVRSPGQVPDARGILCMGVPLSSSARRLVPIIKGNCNITNGSPSTGSSRRLAKHLNCVSQQCDLTTLGGRRALDTQRERFAHCRKGKRLVVAALWNGDIWANLRRLPRGMGVSGQICQKKL